MFDRIAPVYDLMNRLMTAGLDRRWRRLTAEAVVRPGDRVLDACCGTGDLAIAAQEAGGRVTGLDFSERMLERARRKSSSIEWVRGDLLELPFDDTLVRVGNRRLRRPQRGGSRTRASASSVASSRPGGRLGILEITQPRGLLRPFYQLWFDVLVPLAGKLLPGGIRVHVPAGERPPLSRPGRARGAHGAGRASSTFATGCWPGASWRSILDGDVTAELAITARHSRPDGLPRGDRGSPAPRRSRRIPGSWRRSGGRCSPPAASGSVRSSATSPHPTTPSLPSRPALAVELVHMATLVHDDLIDGAEFRRGSPAAWSAYGAGAGARGRRLPVRARVRGARRRSTTRGRSTSSPMPRSASPAERRCSAGRRTTRTRPPRPTSSAAR